MIVLGLAGALAYGFADFLGGLASRRVRPIVATAWVAVIGLVPLGVGLLFLGGRFSADALLWGAVAGLSGSIGVLMLYTALAVGPMSVLSPLTSVVSALVPVAVGVLVAGAVLPGRGIAAVVAAVIAVALVATVRDPAGARLTGRGLGTAFIAGAGFGGLVLAYAATSPEDGLAPLLVARAIQVAVMWIGVGAIARPARRGGAEADRVRPSGRSLWLLLGFAGILDASANVFIQAALHAGDPSTALPVVGVLNALYPIGTVILAAVVLRERLTWLQLSGLAIALVASAVLASL